MKKMFLYFFIVLGVLILVVVFLRFFSPEDTWICKNGDWVKHGNPSKPKPTEQCEAITKVIKEEIKKVDCTTICTEKSVVCAKDGKTYDCEEQAKCNKTEVLYKGDCGTMNFSSCIMSDFASREECKKVMQNRIDFENYIKENISTLSPKKEVLGGKFYTTKFVWADDNNGIVSYEDGHIAFNAKFNIGYEGNDIKVSFFEIQN